MGIARTFTKNSSYQISANIITKFTSLFLVVYLTTLLAPYDFGLYAWVISIALLADVFADMGTNVTLIRYVSESLGIDDKGKAASFFRFAFKIRAVMIAVVASLLFLFSQPLAVFVFGKPFLAVPIQAAALFLVAHSIQTFFQSMFIAIKKMQYVLYSSIVLATFKITLMVGLVLWMSSFYGAVIGFGLSLLASTAVLLFFLLRRFGFFLREHAAIERSKVFSFTKFAAVSSFALIIFVNIDIMMVSILLPIENVGFYNIAMSWSSAVLGFIPIFLIFPVLSGLASKPRQHLEDAFRLFFRYSLFSFVPLAFILAFVSAPLINFFYSSAYQAVSAEILFVLSFLVAFNGLASFLVLLYNSVERPDVPAKTYFVVIVLNIVMNYFFITLFGVVGAAYATLTSYLLLSAAFLLFLKPVSGITPSRSDLVKPFFSALVMFGFLLLLPSTGNFFLAIAYSVLGLAVYLLIQLLIRGITVSEVLVLKRKIVG